MNPLLQSFLGSLLRSLLFAGAGYLVNAGVITHGEAETYITAFILFILPLGWSLWEKSQARKKLLTALMLPPGTTEKDVTTYLKAGGVAPVSSTPSDTAPGIPKQ
jgi:hypothetical protein